MIKLIGLRDNCIYINSNSICLIDECESGTFIVLMCGNRAYYVKETPEQILALMGIDSVMEVVDE